MTYSLDNVSDLDREIGVTDEEYEAPSDLYTPFPGGRYTLIVDLESEIKFGDMTQDGEPSKGLWTNLRFKVFGGPHDGRRFFDLVTSRIPTKRDGTVIRKASELDDFIRAAGSALRPRTKQEYIDAVQQIAGPLDAIVGWKWQCRDCNLTVWKQPPSTSGHIIECEKCGKKLGARETIKRFIVPSAAKAQRGGAA